MWSTALLYIVASFSCFYDAMISPYEIDTVIVEMQIQSIKTQYVSFIIWSIRGGLVRSKEGSESDDFDRNLVEKKTRVMRESYF